MWQCATLIERYYSYPKKVNVEIIQQPVQFPWVSVCNNDHLDILNVARTKPLFQRYIDGTDADIDEDLLNWEKAYREFWDTSTYFFIGFEFPPSRSEYLYKLLEAVYSRIGFTANLGVDLASSGGIKLNDFIVSCRFMGKECDINESFVKFFDPYYFNCFTFRLKGDMTTRTNHPNGVENGLTILLFVGSGSQVNVVNDAFERVLPGMTSTEYTPISSRGAKVVVHPPNTATNPSSQSYDAPAGFSVTLGVRVSENVRMPAPWGNCTKHEDNTTFMYTLRDCHNECLQKQVMQSCGCIDNKVSIPSSPRELPFCLQLPPKFCPAPGDEACTKIRDEWLSRVTCPEEVFLNISRGITIASDEVCFCYAPCWDVQYDSSYSLSNLPENAVEQYVFYKLIDDFLQKMPERKKKMVHEKFGDNYVANISRYMTRLTVYIADNNILRTIESADYEGIRLISDIGGLLGMWIGISVITLFEMFQLVADVCKSITAGNEQQTLTYTKKHRMQPVDHVVDIHVGPSDWCHELDETTRL